MRNNAAMPALALSVAIVIALIVLATWGSGPPAELQLGAVAGALTLAIYAIQGLISVALEGEELQLGRRCPRLTDPLSLAIVVLALALFAIAGLLAHGIAGNWSPARLGGLAGAGCLLLALVLIVYKEAFVGDEASFDDRDDGVPW